MRVSLLIGDSARAGADAVAAEGSRAIGTVRVGATGERVISEVRGVDCCQPDCVRRRSERLNPNSANNPIPAVKRGGQIDHPDAAFLPEAFWESDVPSASGSSPSNPWSRPCTSVIGRRFLDAFSRDGSADGSRSSFQSESFGLGADATSSSCVRVDAGTSRVGNDPTGWPFCVSKCCAVPSAGGASTIFVSREIWSEVELRTPPDLCCVERDVCDCSSSTIGGGGTSVTADSVFGNCDGECRCETSGEI